MALIKFSNIKSRQEAGIYKHIFHTDMEYMSYMLNYYLVQGEKVEHRYFTGINCDDDPRSAYQDFINTKIKFNKYDPENEKSREFKHFILTFDPEESKMLGAENINKMTREIVEQIPEFKDYQISIITHEDKHHIHSHIILNTTNIKNGKKYQEAKSFMTKFQHYVNEYTKQYGLKKMTLPNELPLGVKNVSYDKIDYNMHQNGKLSKNEKFARKIENIIEKTKNRYELFKAMKENNMTMKWTEDSKYVNDLSLGKITIIDNETGESHRLESLYKKYNVYLFNNKDLVSHFEKLDEINKLKNERIIKNVKIKKEDLINVSDAETINKIYGEIQSYAKENKKLKFYDLDIEKRKELREFAKKLIDNSPKLKESIKTKTNEMLTKAKEINKDLDYEKEKSAIENKLVNIMANKIFNQVKFNREKKITSVSTKFLVKSLIECIKYIDQNNIDKNSSNKGMYETEAEKQQYKDTMKAITY